MCVWIFAISIYEKIKVIIVEPPLNYTTSDAISAKRRGNFL